MPNRLRPPAHLLDPDLSREQKIAVSEMYGDHDSSIRLKSEQLVEMTGRQAQQAAEMMPRLDLSVDNTGSARKLTSTERLGYALDPEIQRRRAELARDQTRAMNAFGI